MSFQTIGRSRGVTGHWPTATGTLFDNNNSDTSVDNIALQLLIWITDDIASKLGILIQIMDNIVSFLFKKIFYQFLTASVL
jgi:hypothetical protein